MNNNDNRQYHTRIVIHIIHIIIINLLRNLNGHRDLPAVVGVVFLSSHKSIEYVFVAFGLERLQNKNDRSQVDPLVVSE